MIRFGLCCKFENEPIKFRTTTATHLQKLSKKDRLLKLSELCKANALALKEASEYCIKNQIGCFRVNSRILPLKTHPNISYSIKDLPEGKIIHKLFLDCGKYAKKNDLRFSFHPDQFILLSSLNNDVTLKSIEELEYQAEVSEWIGADVINIHGGGAYGDKQAALKRFKKTYKKLSSSVKNRLSLENDDRSYTPEDLLPLCSELNIPLVYDVHHHRCLPDSLSIEDVTKLAIKTWNREPLFHLSSPREGWDSRKPQYHHDYINIIDFPICWRNLDITVEIEAKAKELAIKKLKTQIEKHLLYKGE